MEETQRKEVSGMTQQELFGLMERFEAGNFTRLQYEENGTRIVLEKEAFHAMPLQTSSAAVVPQMKKTQAAQEECCIKTPLVGTFHAAPERGKPAFVKEGDAVKKGQTVCIIEAMKMINEVPAPCDCIIEKVLAHDGALAGYDEPLFLIREL